MWSDEFNNLRDKPVVMFRKKLVLLLLICLGILSEGNGQFVADNIAKHYNLADGLSQAVVNSISQDNQSFLWLATEDGLNRFDGYDFKVFKVEKGVKNSLSGNYIASLLHDKEGALWVSSRVGLHKFDPRSETFQLYAHNFNVSGTSSLNDVSYISEGSQKNLWVTWYANGFASFDKESKVFTPYNRSNLPSLSSSQTLCIHDDKHGMLWVGTQYGGLNVFSLKNGKVSEKIETISNAPEIPDQNIRCLTEDQHKNIWIGTSRGLVVYLRNSNRMLNFNANREISGKNIVSLLADSDDNLWIGTQGDGLFRLDLRQIETRRPDDFAFVKIDNLGEFDFSSKTVQSLFQDNSGNIWVGIFGEGLYMIGHQQQKFIKFKKYINKGSSLVAASVGGMCKDPEGNLWIGTYGSGIYVKSITGRADKTFLAEDRPGAIKDNTVLSALCDSKGNLWFGTYAHGVFKYDKKSDKFTPVRYHGAERSGAQDVRVLFEDSSGNLWVGTNRGGLCKIDETNNTYYNPAHFSGILRDGDVRAITQDAKGNLWLGFYGDGLCRYDFSTNVLTRMFQKRQDKAGYIDSRIVHALAYDDQDRIWFGMTDDGLFLYDLKSQNLTNFSEENGLANNTVFAIALFGNTCWASTNSGISKVETPSMAITNYGTDDGLHSGQYNSGSVLSNPRAGYVCFGNANGITAFFPREIDDEVEWPEVNITGLQLFNKPVSIRDSLDGQPLLKESMTTAKEITLPYDQAVITLEFAAMNYLYPEKNIYAYKLEGLDANWNYVKQQRSATYRYLKPARYIFKVKASNSNQSWGEEYRSLSIIITPPFWRTTTAYALYAVFLFASSFIIYRITRKQVSLRKRLKIEKAERKHERRMAMEKLTFFTEISHEFRTPLTLILGPIEEMLSKEEKQSDNERKLRMVHRNANKLLGLINKLIDYRKIESGNVVLRVQEADVVQFVESVFDTFKDLAARKNIEYTFQSEVPSLDLWFDKEKLEMVLTNILSNSFKYIGEGKRIAVSVALQVTKRYPLGRAVIKIEDDGIGIPKRHLGSIFEWFYKGETSGSMNSGIGLSLARKLTLLHKGDIYVESTLGKGSAFSVKIPIGKEHFKSDEVTFIQPQEAEKDGVTIAGEVDDESLAKRRVPTLLIIEDDDEIRLFLHEYFEGKYKIFEATNGDEGIQLANVHHPDLIISDIMMPGKNGIDVCKVLKSNMRTSHIPVILLTAKASRMDQKEGIDTGADAYMTKPFSPDILSSTIENLLQSRKQLMKFYRQLFVEDQQANTTGTLKTTPDEKFLQTIFEQLKTNLDKPDFNVGELAETLNMSRSLVYKKIKMLTGLSPTEYIRSLRMQEAAKLLRSKTYKVFEVVYMVGFSDLKYFRESFTKEFGVTPSEFMRQETTE